MIRRALLISCAWVDRLLVPANSRAAEKFTTIYSARVMAQALPWIAEEAGLFKKYNLDHSLVFIASSSIVTAALLGGDPDMTMTGGVGNVIAFVRGSTEIAYVGSAKNLDDAEHHRRRQSETARRSERQTDRSEPHRQQLALFYDSSVAPPQHGAQPRLHFSAIRRRS